MVREISQALTTPPSQKTPSDRPRKPGSRPVVFDSWQKVIVVKHAYWAMLIFKGCLVLGVIFSAVAFWSWRLRPDLTANNRAQQELEVAKAELEKILRRQTEIELTYASSEQEKIKAEKKLREIEVEISEALLDLDAAKNQLAEIENIAKRKETAVKALGSFK